MGPTSYITGPCHCEERPFSFPDDTRTFDGQETLILVRCNNNRSSTHAGASRNPRPNTSRKWRKASQPTCIMTLTGWRASYQVVEEEGKPNSSSWEVLSLPRTLSWGLVSSSSSPGNSAPRMVVGQRCSSGWIGSGRPPRIRGLLRKVVILCENARGDGDGMKRKAERCW